MVIFVPCMSVSTRWSSSRFGGGGSLQVACHRRLAERLTCHPKAALGPAAALAQRLTGIDRGDDVFLRGEKEKKRGGYVEAKLFVGASLCLCVLVPDSSNSAIWAASVMFGTSVSLGMNRPVMGEMSLCRNRASGHRIALVGSGRCTRPS